MGLQDTPSPRNISSPLRRLTRIHNNESAPETSLPSIHDFERFDKVFALTPCEILSLQENLMDYICGVPSASGRPCWQSLYCNHHSFEERKDVTRSLPLECLIIEESQNTFWFSKRRHLAKLYYECKSYWEKYSTESSTPHTCSQTSCTNHEKSSVASSPICVSPASNHSSQQESFKPKRTFSSLKEAFLKKLSRSTESQEEDKVTYLFYRLACYEVVEIDVRARELEARFDMNEFDFDDAQIHGSI